MTRAELTDLAASLWRGLPLLWQIELDAFVAYETLVDQELTQEGLELWMARVQAGQCPVAGSGCDKPKRGAGRFCARHRALAAEKKSR
jgi:hypothetical protein